MEAWGGGFSLELDCGILLSCCLWPMLRKLVAGLCLLNLPQGSITAPAKEALHLVAILLCSPLGSQLGFFAGRFHTNKGIFSLLNDSPDLKVLSQPPRTSAYSPRLAVQT